jgi:two-component system response regulator FixJ
MQPTVYVVDDDKLVRESLAWLIGTIHLPVVLYENGQDFLAGYVPQRPGCLILDVRMPGLSGMDLHVRLSERGIELPVIIVTGHADVPMATRAMKAGAFDFIEKPYNDQLMLETVQNAIAFDLDRRRRAQQIAALRARFKRLTPREREVMALIIQGRSNKVIADRLDISVKTVELHRANIMAKVEVRSAAELVRLAVTAGLDALG